MKDDEAKATQDLLILVSYQVTLKEIRSWSPERRARIETWAGACYLRASDNHVRVPSRPRFKHKELSPAKFKKQLRML